jgi:hypothetical protein
MREAIYGQHSNRLLLVRYETLTSNPLGTLAAIYGFIGEPLFSHDERHIEPDDAAMAFDARLGAPGLHEVGSPVRIPSRPTILPPDLFARFEKDDFGTTRRTCRRRFGSSDCTSSSEVLAQAPHEHAGRECLRNNMSALFNAIDRMSSP